MKSVSFLVKIIMVIVGFALCILKWTNTLPNATIQEIWFSIGFAYGVGLGTIDFNICRDNWIEKKEVEE
jgi:hypothetical protein